jgi:hypothetical protein
VLIIDKRLLLGKEHCPTTHLDSGLAESGIYFREFPSRDRPAFVGWVMLEYRQRGFL